jgi:2-keto-4-pentenoate hydratase/2-oxohepta-3-ene-1,7-dioic acid hydratase in catechol pathway
MKLLRYGNKGYEKPGVLDINNQIRSLEGVIDDVSGATLDNKTIDRLKKIDLTELPIVPSDTRFGPCVAKVGKFICIGLNYADHAAESGMEIPSEPEVFTKAISAICGPNDNIEKPRASTKLDWEVELAIVIGKPTKYVKEEDAIDHIAGYCICNDVSERSFQLEKGSQWDKGKGCDTFGPIGPYLVTSDDVPEPNNLDMWLEVNGHRFQNGNTRTMIFRPAFIVSYLSQFMSLQPGDIISTGTPPGVGLGQKPPRYLSEGDVISLGIEGLGIQKQKVVSSE